VPRHAFSKGGSRGNWAALLYLSANPTESLPMSATGRKQTLAYQHALAIRICWPLNPWARFKH
jgi:hypothetical protein